MNTGWIWCPEVWQYNPSTDSWLRMEDFPGTTRRWATAVNVNDHVYYGLGTNGTNFNDFWEFNPVADIDEFDVNNFNVYPNPAVNLVNFSSENHQNFTIIVYDLNGKAVASSSTNIGETSINRSLLPSGNYIYHVLIEGEKVHSNRLIFI